MTTSNPGLEPIEVARHGRLSIASQRRLNHRPSPPPWPRSSRRSETVRPLGICTRFRVSNARIEFLNAIRSVNPPQKWKILVVDEHSQALLNHVLKQFDILEENVTRACLLLLPITVT